MEVREATEEDIPAIVNLLKQSLGESLMPKSEKYWRWKHLENPFGKSPVLVCWEGNTLTGVRAFMRWQWIHQGKVIRAVRAVDTATHPDHQGKGIFKKLTLSLVDTCTRDGDQFVFNTPNKQSKPGYLKMGWEEAGKLPVSMRVEKPLSILLNLVKQQPASPDQDRTKINYYLQHADLESLLVEHHQQQTKINTNTSVTYLKWRYGNVPVARYLAIGVEEGPVLMGLIIGRLKDTRLGRELRVTDYFLRKESKKKELMGKLKECMKEWDIDYATLSGTLEDSFGNLFRSFYAVSVGPMVTVRSLSMTDLTILKNFNQWSPSLGDLELF